MASKSCNSSLGHLGPPSSERGVGPAHVSPRSRCTPSRAAATPSASPSSSSTSADRTFPKSKAYTISRSRSSLLSCSTPAEAGLALPPPTRCAAGSRLASVGTPLRAHPRACVSADNCGHHDCAVGGQPDAAARPHSTGTGTVHTDARTTRRTSAKADGASHVPPAA